MLRPDDERPYREGLPPDEATRELLQQLLIQLHLAEVLTRRLVGLQQRRLGPGKDGGRLRPEIERVESELRAAQDELERLRCLAVAGDLAHARTSDGF